MAGDPLLAPYVTSNPGVGWLALPSANVQPYVETLKHNLTSSVAKGAVNVVAGRWVWVTGRYGLLIDLVSGSLSALHVASPARNAADLCAASRGEPSSQLVSIRGVPGSVSGLCALPPGSAGQVATVIAFHRANVAVLMEMTSKSKTPIDVREATLVAQRQYGTLPVGGVLVSNGFDLDLVVLWLVLLAALVFGVIAFARKKNGWRAPLDAAVVALRRRRLALGVSLVAVIGALTFSMVDSSLLHGSGQWFESSYNDFWRNWADSAFLTYGGGYAHIYQLDQTLETAPAIQVVLAPIARLAWGLSFPNPNVVLYPQAYWVAGPLLLALMVFPIVAADRWLEYMGVTDWHRRLVVLGTMGITLPPIVLFGHAEDLVALGAMLYGLVAAMEQRNRAAGWWLGVALAFQFFAILAVPIALVLLKRRAWLGAVVPMVLVPAAFLVVPLVADFSGTVAPTGPPGRLRRPGLHQSDVAARSWRGRLRPGTHRVGGGARGPGAAARAPSESGGRGKPDHLGHGHPVHTAGARAGAGALLPRPGSCPAPAQRGAAKLVAPRCGLSRGGVVELVGPFRRGGSLVLLAAPHRSDRRPRLARLATRASGT